MRKHIAFITTLFSAITLPIVVFADPSSGQADGWHMGWGMGQGWGFGHGFFGILWMVLFWGGLIALIVFAVRKLTGSSDHSGASESGRTPLDILKERFARGEFDKEEFEERRRLLR